MLALVRKTSKSNDRRKNYEEDYKKCQKYNEILYKKEKFRKYSLFYSENESFVKLADLTSIDEKVVEEKEFKFYLRIDKPKLIYDEILYQVGQNQNLFLVSVCLIC